MFENLQDTSLLRDALLSSVHLLITESESKKDLEYSKEILLSVSSSIKSICSSEQNIDGGKNKVTSERCHTAVFLSVLKFCKISCEDSVAHYESIYHSYPSLDMKLYLYLNFIHDWSDFFVKSSTQLPLAVLSNLLEKILHVKWKPFEEDAPMYHSLHMVIQSVVWKVFCPDDKLPSTVEVTNRFNFPYSLPVNSTSSNLDDEEESLKDLYLSVLNRLNYMMSSETFCKSQISKVTLHAYKSILKVLPHIKNSETFIMNLCILNKLLQDSFESVSLEKLENNHLKLCHTHVVLNTLYNENSWFVDSQYLLFALHNYVYDTLLNATQDNSTSFSSIVHNWVTENTNVFGKFDQFYKMQFKNLEILKIILRYKLPYYSRAASMLLDYEAERKNQDFLKSLEERASSLCALETYHSLTDAVVKSASVKTKIMFLNIFYQTFSQASDETFSEMFTYVLNKYGYADHFKLPDYNNQLMQYVRKTMLLQESKINLMKLFMQCPKVTLRTIIEQALIRGSEGMSLVQIVKHIPTVCLYENCLVLELSKYFSKKELETHESKNLYSLIKTIMEVQAQQDIVSFEMYLKLCFFSSALSSSHNRLELNLECLNVSLECLTSKESFSINSKSCLSLLEFISSLIQASIMCGYGKIKQLAINTLFQLSKIQNESFSQVLKAELGSFSQMTRIYLCMYFCDQSIEVAEPSTKLSQELFVWCCSRKNSAPFQKCISCYEISFKDLLNIIIPLITHLTKDEWIELSKLLEIYFKHEQTRNNLPNFPWLLSQKNPVAYTVARCLLEAFAFAVEDNPGDVHYMTSSFTHALADLLKLHTSPLLLVNVFIDACHLLTSCDSEVQPTLCSFLVTVGQGIHKSCKDKESKKAYLLMMVKAVSCLPDFEGKSILLQKFL